MLEISVMAMCYNDSFIICVHHSVLFSLLIFGTCIAESMLFTSVILSLSLFVRLTHKTMSYQHTFVNCQPYIEINSS
jgi:Na+-transporting NADH:ubiquinone oxidoreductase subunit NqrB